jgi:circadian clock protein KaiC
MTRRKVNDSTCPPTGLEKSLTGIPGIDQITNGGLPKGRTTLLCGTPGTGKTLLGMTFLVNGCTKYGEPGLFVSFEETPGEISENVKSLGMDTQGLAGQEQLLIEHVMVERNEIEETGEYDLEALFIRLGYAIDSIGAKRVVLDTIESLFSSLSNAGILRSELRRMFRWFKEKGITVIVTGERGDAGLTRQGLEEYVSDCVILLDQRTEHEISTRRLHVVKYRGSAHGSNEYPFLIDEYGFTVNPITSIDQQYEVGKEFVSSGIKKLDIMLGGKGYYRGGTVLVSGAAGAGKSSCSAHFVDAACRRGEHCIYYAFEESKAQIVRNMRSIGIDLQPWIDKGLLYIHSIRPSSYGLEMLLTMIERDVEQYQSKTVVFDPVSSLEAAGSFEDAKNALMRLVDFLKSRNITALCTSLTTGGTPLEQSEVGISSLIDSWILLRNMEMGGERTRLLSILKSRGMAHNNRVREFVLSEKGVDLIDVYMGPEGILTGTFRAFQEAQDKNDAIKRKRSVELAKKLMKSKRMALEARIAELETQFVADTKEVMDTLAEQEADAQALLNNRQDAASLKKRMPTTTRKKQQGTKK